MKAKYLRIAPDRIDGRPVIEIELISGESILVPLDRGHGRSVADRIVECVDGRISARAPSRRVLEIELAVDATADTVPVKESA